ncbi:HTH-type transcriptional regulator DmlR [Andreprevotia sp. IGB-42]|uniref:LysR family transcriptional regulator n=1 Tax=Andreprevotia sp. IGB-42 TaxID=2497473 RepID=UPI00157ED09A|nr:LysR family transcriptional regulator [Andreprevotia sp. IGB-42]KAF0811705.1 HTH-type transcriptional regulator DmlR [Andreprevotia sp. IGB-42]
MSNEHIGLMRDMAVFVRVVEAGSFSAAALQLGITPSAASRQLARLEKALGIRLLERTTRTLRLSEAGAEAFERAQAMEAAARSLLSLSDKHVEAPRGAIRISMPKAFGRIVVHPLMPAFLHQYPQVDVQMVITDRLVHPIDDGVDLVIRISDQPPPGLAGRPLLQVEHVIAASPAYLAAQGMPAHPADLAQHSCLYLGEVPGDNRWRFKRGAESAMVTVHGRYASNHSEMRLGGALADLGIASLPSFTAQQVLASGELVQVLPDWQHLTPYAGMAWLLYPPNRFLATKLRVFIDYLAIALPSME